jgi:excinuclease ABC subunit C
LDEIPGLGQARRATLLRHFGSVRKLKAASAGEIAALPGFGQRTAEAVHAALHPAALPPAAQPPAAAPPVAFTHGGTDMSKVGDA